MPYELERINRAQVASEVDRFTEGRYRQFARHLGRGFYGQALDVGCNTGRGGRAFLTAASHVTLDGVEMLANRLERSRQRPLPSRVEAIPGVERAGRRDGDGQRPEVRPARGEVPYGPL